MSDGTIPTPEMAQLDCPECRTSITYYDVAGSEYYACPQCHAYFRYSGEERPVVYGNYNQVPAEKPLVALGTLLLLAGQLWRVVGFVLRCEIKAVRYRWTEYQLLAPETGGYAQLAQFHGHWTLIRSAPGEGKKYTGPQTRPESDFQLADFKLYNRYQSRVLWAVGEFDWDIEGDKDVTVSEYINPPLMLVQEQRGDVPEWYRAQHVDRDEVATAFGREPADLPHAEGIGAIEPSPVRNLSALITITALAVSLVLTMQLVMWGRHPSQRLLNGTLKVQADTTATATPGTGRVIVSPPFTLDHPAALKIGLTTSLSNQWLELPVSVVNEQTGRGFEFTKNIEFYSGVEDGESWTEGSRDASATLSAVPAGRYHLNFYPVSEAGPAAPTIVVTVDSDAGLMGNFFSVLALLLIYPLLQIWRRSSFETRRWEESDFGPSS